ncbi:DNA damage-binding protein 1a [Camellia lanceoleosa]|uniref:DNA damage-binding protein 1a n=1 Tax=Camellia lanceoleosa TaxID=1840588 RepID=A0ACC0IZ00_9ERIC|nr:DNA damage-binding protein 1a [Camellia lanceoleosa]
MGRRLEPAIRKERDLGMVEEMGKDNKDAHHVKTYEVVLKDKDFVEGPWSQNNLDNGADLLIPVPLPLCGVLIIGEETIVYYSASAFKGIPI